MSLLFILCFQELCSQLSRTVSSALPTRLGLLSPYNLARASEKPVVLTDKVGNFAFSAQRSKSNDTRNTAAKKKEQTK